MKYEVYENDAGLYMAVIENDKCVRIIEGFEQNAPGILRDALNELQADESAYLDWDGNLVESLNNEGMEVTAASLYEEGLGTLIVESSNNGSPRIDIDSLGAHGSIALGIE